MNRRNRILPAVLISLVAGMLLGIQSVGGLGGAGQALAQTAPQVTAGGPYTGAPGVPMPIEGGFLGAGSPVFSWDFGDGGTGSGEVTFHTYGAPGTYTVTVTLLDASTGLSSTASTTATIAGANVPQASIGGPYAGSAGVPIAMSGGFSGAGSPVFIWNFGDGTTGSGQVTSHVYGADGAYIVTLTLIDAVSGQSSTVSTTATISG